MSAFTEEDYLEYLEHERHMFAWCLEQYESRSPDAAKAQAELFYAYEPVAGNYRWLVFHDVAWHWAMMKIIGDGYWNTRRDLEKPSAEYEAESQRFAIRQAHRSKTKRG